MRAIKSSRASLSTSTGRGAGTTALAEWIIVKAIRLFVRCKRSIQAIGATGSQKTAPVLPNQVKSERETPRQCHRSIKPVKMLVASRALLRETSISP
ncbi:MAG TPA: hypothetical protein VHI72_10940 [Hyphomicrobiaceae bacterium]|jgi:hypothetical protein|nr:hypothetical protein [Hyphomicrobiaceae bacterium]